jgi:hypothetical protein
MNLKRCGENGCLAASVAMLLGVRVDDIERIGLFNPCRYEYPFPAPWARMPKVATMDEVCEWMYKECKIGLVPFAHNPGCSAARECPMTPVWSDGRKAFRRHLSYGAGLLEGHVEHMRGHMCAWDGKKVYDPRGNTYRLEDALHYDFTPTRFWLKVQGE